jgi:CheY-like chemotaxis protein/signal transduction histidine kinase/CHASE3 domain sensor protein
MPLSTPNAPLAFRRILSRNLLLPLALGVASALVFLALLAYLVTALREVERVDQVLARASAAQNLDLDIESGVRGFLVAGDERFLQPYERAWSALTTATEQLRRESPDPQQQERVARIRTLQSRWHDEFARPEILRKRQDPAYVSRTPLGRELKDAIREEFDQFFTTERRARAERTQEANRNTLLGAVAFVLFMLAVGGGLAWRGRRDLMGLSQAYETAFQGQQRQAEALEAHSWLRDGQTRLSQRLASEQEVAAVGHAALEVLSQYVGILVGALYLPEASGGFVRAATWGWSPSDDQEPGARIPADRTLLAECAAQRRQIPLPEVPPGYLRVSSALGEATVRSVLLAPVEHQGRLTGVLELGWMRPLEQRDAELITAVGSVLGASIESARYRQRLQDVLNETQQLNQELQVQQEELRTANEELEEQSKALKESQAHLESQQAELEQTNVQLAEQADRLENQRDQLREAQVTLEERAAELQRASRYKSEFLANMSHELRTPLNSSLILARLLADNKQGNLTEEQVKFAESIHTAGNDLLNLINDILDIAKVEAGKLELRPEVVPLGALTEGLKTMFEPMAARKGLQLTAAVGEDVPASMYTDRQRLEQVLRNLLSNAVKFTDQGSVTLRVVRSGTDRIAFEVRDSGIGIDPTQQDLVFEAFRQADGTSIRKYGGTGLGLSISRDLARLLGGDIAVASAAGQGSVFTVLLPLEYQESLAQRPVAMGPPLPAPVSAPAAQPAPTAPPARVPPPSFADDRELPGAGRRTVLVVEDDTRFAGILFDLAHELGYRCLVAHDADEGCRLAFQHFPDAVLLDILLPGDSGLTVLQKLKDDARTRHIPVHVLSAEDRMEPALQLGAIGYARKPTTREELQQVFSRLEAKLSQKVKRVLLVEDDRRQQESVMALIGDGDVEIVAVSEGAAALRALSESVFDCMIIDLALPDMSGQELLRRMAAGESRSFPPVIVYTGRNLTRDEEAELMRYSRSIIIKGARSPERLLDEVTLFLHKVETQLSSERQKMLRTARSRDKAFEGRRILLVDDDMRNIFALASALEHKGSQVEVARNGVEALQKLEQDPDGIDLVLMDIMMPEMDGHTATREIRKNPRWEKLPIIAITAKAMKEDQERCLAAGANDYLAKPIELERLLSLMRVWMPKLERI